MSGATLGILAILTALILLFVAAFLVLLYDLMRNYFE